MSKLQKDLWFTVALLVLLAAIALLGWLDWQASRLGQPTPAVVLAPRPVDSSSVLEIQIGGTPPGPEAPPEKIFDFSGLSLGDAIAKGGAEGARPAAEVLGKAGEVAGEAAAKAIRQIPEAVEEAEKNKEVQGRRPK